jgi:hypothetical protein
MRNPEGGGGALVEVALCEMVNALPAIVMVAVRATPVFGAIE